MDGIGWEDQSRRKKWDGAGSEARNTNVLTEGRDAFWHYGCEQISLVNLASSLTYLCLSVPSASLGSRRRVEGEATGEKSLTVVNG